MSPPALLFYPQCPRAEAVAATMRLALVPIEKPRSARLVRAWRNNLDFAQAMAAAATSDAMRRPTLGAARRVHDREWYVRRFSPRT